MLVMLATLWLGVSSVAGQTADVQAVPSGAFRGRPSARQPAQTPDATVNAGEQAPGTPPPAEGDKASEAQDKPSDEKAEEPSDSIKRPAVPTRVPDPREFDARPDANARIQFAFHGQLWPDVLQWFATISGYSLDWQELPNDYIHLTTNRQISVPEVRDLLNRLLFERGYTMVVQRDVLLVVKVDKLDPSLLRRVEDEAELMDLPAYDFVKITFSLPEKLQRRTKRPRISSRCSVNMPRRNR